MTTTSTTATQCCVESLSLCSKTKGNEMNKDWKGSNKNFHYTQIKSSAPLKVSENLQQAMQGRT